jgi:hypothetical protein
MLDRNPQTETLIHEFVAQVERYFRADYNATTIMFRLTYDRRVGLKPRAKGEFCLYVDRSGDKLSRLVKDPVEFPDAIAWIRRLPLIGDNARDTVEDT